MNCLISCSFSQIITDSSSVITKTNRASVRTNQAKLLSFHTDNCAINNISISLGHWPCIFCSTLEETMCAHLFPLNSNTIMELLTSCWRLRTTDGGYPRASLLKQIPTVLWLPLNRLSYLPIILLHFLNPQE